MTSVAAVIRTFGGVGPTLARALRVAQRDGLAGLWTRARRALAPPVTYQAWRAAFDDQPETDPARFRERAQALVGAPTIGVIIPVFKPDRALLAAAVMSVRGQIHQNWRLVLCDDGSGDPELSAWLGALEADARVRVVAHAANRGIAAACSTALSAVDAPWFCTLDQDDLLRPHALLEVATAIAANPTARLIYSDEDKIDTAGARFAPAFKPAWSPLLLRGSNYINHLAAARTADVRALGGWRSVFDGAQDHDLWLRLGETLKPGEVVHVPKILYHWRARTGSTAQAIEAKPLARAASVAAVADHLQRLGLDGEVEACAEAPTVAVRYARPTPAPHVTIVIPNRDKPDLLAACLAGVRRSAYPRYDILVVDNQSADPRTFALYEAERAKGRFSTLSYDAPFNYSAMNNRAAAAATGEILVLMNNDVEALDAEWLDAMAALVIQPGVGAVGAKLLYPNGSVQHAGVAVGVCGVAAHPYRGASDRETGYCGRLTIAHEQSAVTAACLAVRAEVYRAVGGFDESDLKVAFNDVDFCLKVGALGLSVVWTPLARLVHHESASRGAEITAEKYARFMGEARTMARRWGKRLRDDPFWPAHLTRTREDASLRDPRIEPALEALLRDVQSERG